MFSDVPRNVRNQLESHSGVKNPNVRKKKASNLELAGGGLGALIGFLMGGPVQAKLGWEGGQTLAQLASAGDIKRSIQNKENIRKG